MKSSNIRKLKVKEHKRNTLLIYILIPIITFILFMTYAYLNYDLDEIPCYGENYKPAFIDLYIGSDQKEPVRKENNFYLMLSKNNLNSLEVDINFQFGCGDGKSKPGYRPENENVEIDLRKANNDSLFKGVNEGFEYSFSSESSSIDVYKIFLSWNWFQKQEYYLHVIWKD